MQIAEQGSNDEQSRLNTATSISVVSGATGPRTNQGKQKSKHNALKHGIFSKIVVLKGEPRAEFDSLLHGLRNSLKPEGTLEDLLVENLAISSWRKRRLLVAEGAEIRKGTEFLGWEEKQNQHNEAENIAFLDVKHSGLVSRITNPKVMEKCLDLLRRLKDEIEESGCDEKEDQAILARLYGDSGGLSELEPSLFEIYKRCLVASKSIASAREGGEEANPEGCKNLFIDFLNKEIKRIKRYKLERAQIEFNRMEVESLRANVPDVPQLERLLRYEATLQRDFDRTLSQLERVQRIRKEQPVLPALNLNVSS